MELESDGGRLCDFEIFLWNDLVPVRMILDWSWTDGEITKGQGVEHA